MNENILVLKSINQLFEYSFFIPSYQRGYRWSDTQVTQLLEDIWQFSQKEGKSKGEFYCLQPIVVKYNNAKFEVIDGQQRLTTIFILIKYLEDVVNIAFQNFTFNSPDYDTRKDSTEFLDNIKDKTENDAKVNIDYFHIWSAYNLIKEWFEKKENNINKIDFLNTLLKFKIEEVDGKKIDTANNVRVIWYEVHEPKTNPIDIFTRINIGKIPLTNAELVKALFLQKDNFTADKVNLKQLQIASEWDAIEKTLQDDAFWYFIYNPENPLKYDNRIEYIFDLMKFKNKDHEFYYTFNLFQKDFTASKTPQENSTIDIIWLSIKQYFLRIEEWFRDPELYHLIGFLIDCKMNINTLKKESEGKTKIKFKEYLITEIKKEVNCQVDDLEYPNKLIKKILLLFNLQTILSSRKAEMKFPFFKYKTDNWDIEHVRSQTTKEISGSNRVDWSIDVLSYFTGINGYSDTIISTNKSEKIMQKEHVDKMPDIEDDKTKDFCVRLIEILDSEKIDDEKFKKLYEELLSYFKEGSTPEDIDNISNLALLDAATNRSYKNAMFPIKRKRIIQNDMNGVFVPIATKNLFLKFYSKKMGDVMYWNESDAKDYIEAIKLTLKDYLPIQNSKNEHK
jgi:uncharacterized protein with ParB-like and HNH nuclease domain